MTITPAEAGLTAVPTLVEATLAHWLTHWVENVAARKVCPQARDQMMTHGRPVAGARPGHRTTPPAGADELLVRVGVVELLHRHWAAQDAEREAAGSLWQDGDWVFAQPNGKPTDPRADHAAWKALLSDAGVRPTRLHDARHTTATMLLVLGVTQRAVMDVTGWSHTSMTVRYQQLTGQVRRDIAEQLGTLLWTEK
jgi:hypothetical protein